MSGIWNFRCLTAVNDANYGFVATGKASLKAARRSAFGSTGETGEEGS